MEGILNYYLMIMFSTQYQKVRVAKMPQKPTLVYRVQRPSEHMHQILEVNTYRDDIEYYFNWPRV